MPADRTPDPIFILAPARSFSSVVCAMLGQHPQMYGLPELHLFLAENLSEWFDLCAQSTFPMADGLVRVVAEIYFGGQDEQTVARSRGWLRRRSHLSTGLVIEMLAQQVAPRILVEKSPSTVYQPAFLQRCHAMFPQARFIHLVRHPRGQGESVMKAIRDRGRSGPAPQWLVHAASHPDLASARGNAQPRAMGDLESLDPQRGWFALHTTISAFLRSLPPEQSTRVRGEDLLADPDRALAELADWLGLHTDPEAIMAMKHPEKSPYARLGPPGAIAGNDFYFLERPALRLKAQSHESLDGPLGWGGAAAGFLPEVKHLAREFGYK